MSKDKRCKLCSWEEKCEFETPCDFYYGEQDDERTDSLIEQYIEVKRRAFHREWARYTEQYE